MIFEKEVRSRIEDNGKNFLLFRVKSEVVRNCYHYLKYVQAF